MRPSLPPIPGSEAPQPFQPRTTPYVYEPPPPDDAPHFADTMDDLGTEIGTGVGNVGGAVASPFVAAYGATASGLGSFGHGVAGWATGFGHGVADAWNGAGHALGGAWQGVTSIRLPHVSMPSISVTMPTVTVNAGE